MAVHVRLQRHGSTHRPFYHVVATDHRNARNGKFIEKLGYYDPAHEPSTFELKAERIQFWYSKGAQLSTTVAKLAKLKNIDLRRETAKA
jgi:small subunit ribosomal protein S16